MKKQSRSVVHEPTMMIHHVKEIQIRILVVVLVLIIGMAVGYLFYEPLFAFIKAPLNGPLHYTSPSGSFSFIIKICMMVGIIATLPVAVYNLIMFVQPALGKKISKVRVYVTTCLSLFLASAGAAFAFFIIIPLALKFFYKFQVDGLVALISADDYLRFVINVVITFVLIFQLPLVISFIDHITPLPPKKLFKAEKFIIVGSVMVGVLVPFALDPTVQLLIASPIIVLYNFSIVVVLLQHYFKARAGRRQKSDVAVETIEIREPVRVPSLSAPRAVAAPVVVVPAASLATQPSAHRKVRRDISGFSRPQPVTKSPGFTRTPSLRVTPRSATRSSRLISDMRRSQAVVPRAQFSSSSERNFPATRAVE